MGIIRSQTMAAAAAAEAANSAHRKKRKRKMSECLYVSVCENVPRLMWVERERD